MKTHRTYLPSYEDCVNICNSFEKNTFYENKYVIKGYNVSLFNYRLAQYNDFIDPLGTGIDAKELRGLCFVFNEDGTVYKRFLLLEKFFNLNQTPESLYENVVNYKIKQINNKEDGSLAGFIALPSGDVVGKSKMGFESPQAENINKIYNENLSIKRFVDFCLNEDIIPIFEYVGPNNRIVLKYKKEQLILLRLRDNKSGRYLDINDFRNQIGDIRIATTVDIQSLDELIEKNRTDINMEGYVIHAEDLEGYDFFYKLKNDWYRTRHGILTNDIHYENKIIEYILEDNIDDVLGEIPKDEVEVIDKINVILDIVRKEVNTVSNEINELYNIFSEMDFNIKEFALKYHKNIYFSGVMGKYKNISTPFESAVKMIGKKTSKLLDARKWLEEKSK